MICDDEGLCSIVRNPKNAGKTAAELLAEHQKELEERLMDDEYEEVKVFSAFVTLAAAIIITGLGVYLWLQY